MVQSSAFTSRSKKARYSHTKRELKGRAKVVLLKAFKTKPKRKPGSPAPEWMSLSDVARLLDCDTRTVRTHVLPNVRSMDLGRTVRICRRSFEKWIEEESDDGGAAPGGVRFNPDF